MICLYRTKIAKMSGYEISRFFKLSENEAKHLKCGICLGIYYKPVVIQCGHSFCHNCIKDWVKTSKTCPLCRHELNDKKRSLATDDNNSDLIIMHSEPTRIVTDLLNDLLIKCDFYDNGCHEEIRLESLPLHLEKCVYNLCVVCELKLGQKSVHSCIQSLKKEKRKCDERINDLLSENRVLNEEKNKMKQELDEELDENRFFAERLDYLLVNHKSLVPQASQDFLEFILSINYNTSNFTDSPQSPSTTVRHSPHSHSYNALNDSYSPQSPSYSPLSPTYIQSSPPRISRPRYYATSPTYEPSSPSYSSLSPPREAISPSYTPTSPSYYSPMSPTYSPYSP